MSSGSADSDPSVPCRDQEIPTFEEWTKIMLEVENVKSEWCSDRSCSAALLSLTVFLSISSDHTPV